MLVGGFESPRAAWNNNNSALPFRIQQVSDGEAHLPM